MSATAAAATGSGGLTAEEFLLRDTAREFAQREIAPSAIERDEQERFDRSIFGRMGELGLTGAPLPEAPSTLIRAAPADALFLNSSVAPAHRS